jgi:photosystem II stability/assembly factor-like uncharacterized protein
VHRSSGEYRSILLSLLILTCLLVGRAQVVFAHNPHDVIDTLELSPSYGQDETLFIFTLVEGLQKSTDGGLSWKILANGLDNRGSVSSIAISPSYSSDQTLFISTRGDGVYRSQDGGASWVKVNDNLDDLNIHLLSISADYDSDRTLLAADTQGGLYKTKNGGGSWYRVLDNGVQVTAMAFFVDEQKNAVLIGDRNGALHLSTDEGEFWQQLFQIPDVGAITSIALSPKFSTDSTFFIGTEKGGVFKTIDGGTSFVATNNGLSNLPSGAAGWCGSDSEQSSIFVRSLAISPDYGTDATVFASTWCQAVFQSNDGGNSWQLYSQGVTTHSQADTLQYRLPHFGDLRISRTFSQDSTIFLGGFAGLFKSTDGGHTWKELEPSPPGTITGLGISPKDDSMIAVTTSGGGLYVMDKQATTWAIHNRGLNRIELMDVAFSPNYHSDGTIFLVSEQDYAISQDGGNRWNATKVKYRESWIKRMLRFVLYKLRLPIPDAVKKPRIILDWIAVSPDFASDNTIYFGTRYDGVYRSVDGTESWSAVWPGHQTASVVISPDFTSDRTLFAVDRHEGVYKTVDGGDTWQSVNDGLTLFVDTQQFPAEKGDFKLVISPNYRTDQIVFLGSPGGLFKTTDGGESWRELEVGAAEAYDFIMGLAISPDYENDQMVIVSVRGKGLFKSDDGGLTFVEIGTDLMNSHYCLSGIEFSPSYATDHTIYGVSREEVFQSTDGGHSWKMFPRPTRYEDKREMIHYEGQWQRLEDSDFSTSSITHSDITHDKAVFNFVGTGITWIGTESDDQGIARVYIDGGYEAEVDQFGEISRFIVTSFSIDDLDYGPHTITVEVTDTKNPASRGHRIAIDAFDVVR